MDGNLLGGRTLPCRGWSREDVCAIGWYQPHPNKREPSDEAATAIPAKNLNSNQHLVGRLAVDRYRDIQAPSMPVDYDEQPPIAITNHCLGW